MSSAGMGSSSAAQIIPGLPGAANSFASGASRLRMSTHACSRPPLPTISRFIFPECWFSLLVAIGLGFGRLLSGYFTCHKLRSRSCLQCFERAFQIFDQVIDVFNTYGQTKESRGDSESGLLIGRYRAMRHGIWN